MHFSGCPASCAQPQIADVGFRGDTAHVGDHLVEAVDIGLGGSLGSDAAFIDWIEGARPVDEVPEALLAGGDAVPGRATPGRGLSQLGPAHPERGAAEHAVGDGDGARHRGAAVKGFRIREEMNGVEEPPGKTWFWELEAGVIFADRCIQCGTCVAVCPSNSLGVNAEVRPSRAREDVHRLLVVLGLLSPRRPALRGAVAAVVAVGRGGRGPGGGEGRCRRHVLEVDRWTPR